MSILEKLEAEIKSALKNKDKPRLDCVRLIKSTVKNKEIELIHPLSEEEFVAVLSTMAKQRRESIDQFQKGGRTDLVENEQTELKIIESFLPEPLTDSKLDELISQAITQANASGPKDMGLVMKVLKSQVAGRADGKVVSEKVKNKLAQL